MIALGAVVWVTGAGGLALAVALVGSLRRRAGRWSVRLAGLAAVAIAWWAAFDRTATDQVDVPPHVWVVPTSGSNAGEWLELIRRRAADVEGSVDVLAATPTNGNATLAERVAAAEAAAAAAGQLESGGRASELLVVWDGAWDLDAASGLAVAESSAARSTGAGTRKVTLLSTVPPPPIDPGAIEVRALAAFEVGRSGAFEVRCSDSVAPQGPPPPGDGELRVLDAADRVVASRVFDLGELWSARRIECLWLPENAGEFRVELDLDGLAGGRFRGRTRSFDVVPARSVLVVGSGAASVGAALEAQGLVVQAEAALPNDLEQVGVIVLLDPIPSVNDSRLIAFVDAGGGLLLCGGPAGGALPESDRALAELAPFRRLDPLPAVEEPGSAPGDGAGPVDPTADDPDPEPPQPAEPVASDPGPDPSGSAEPPPDEGPVTGSTAGARLNPDSAPVEVERRSIALVLVIDRSGSMELPAGAGAAGLTRMDLAKRSAFDSAQQLEPGDELGIIALSSRPISVLPLGPVPKASLLRSKLEELRGAGGTFIGTSIELAGEWLAPSEAAIKHVVVISDGQFEDRVSDPNKSKSSARRLAARGITVSVILFTEESLVSDFREIAGYGKGRFVLSRRFDAVPELLFAEVQRARGGGTRDQPGAEVVDTPPPMNPDRPEPREAAEPEATEPEPEPDPEPTDPESANAEPEPTELAPAEPIAESGDRDSQLSLRVMPVRFGAADLSRLIEPRPPSGYPKLGGVVAVHARHHAVVLLVVSDGTPLLGFNHFGLGRVGCWSADLTGDWSAAWREAAAFPGWLAAWITALRPPSPLLAEAASGDLLESRRVTPSGPSYAERRALAELVGQPQDQLPLLDSWQPPRKLSVDRTRGLGSQDAWFALLAAIALAVVEFIARRTRGG